MMTHCRNTLLGAALTGFFFLLSAPQVSAASLNLFAFNSTADGLDLSMEVAVSDGLALFSFANNSTGDASGSSVARIYFESGLVDAGLSAGMVLDQSGTLFASSFPGPSAPPSGNIINWTGELDAFGAQAPGPVNGLNVGDALTIAFTYEGTLESLVGFLTDVDGNARVAAHILDCSDGNSCAATVVPVPAALPLLFSALAGLGFASRRKAS